MFEKDGFIYVKDLETAVVIAYELGLPCTDQVIMEGATAWFGFKPIDLVKEILARAKDSSVWSVLAFRKALIGLTKTTLKGK